MSGDWIRWAFAEAKAVIRDDHFVYAKKSDGWYHGEAYVNKDAFYPEPKKVKLFCEELAKHFQHMEPEVVVGPTVGGVALSQWTAYHLPPVESHGVLRDVAAVYADEEDVLEEVEIDVVNSISVRDGKFTFVANGQVRISVSTRKVGIYSTLLGIKHQLKVATRRVLKRGYDKIVSGRRCLIVEDIITSGATVQKVIQAIRNAGGGIVGVGALCNRSGGKVTAETLGVPMLFSLMDMDLPMYPEETCPVCKEKGEQSVRLDLGKGKEFLLRKGIPIPA